MTQYRPGVPRAVSRTHEHLAAAVLAELDFSSPRRHAGEELRLVDAGCGDGQLLAYLSGALSTGQRQANIQLFGFDVLDHGVQRPGFLQKATERLQVVAPGEPWDDRIQAIAMSDPWPYPDSSMDVVVSNQVCEHVRDLDAFFGENARVLKPRGVAVHVFPLENYVIEGHLLLPFVHRIHSHDGRAALIRALSRVGLGKYPRLPSDGRGSVDDFAQRHADYIHFLTSYRRWREVVASAARARLRVSYRYTNELYVAKARAIAGREPRVRYRRRRSSLLDTIGFHAAKFVSSVTVVLEQENAYDRGPPRAVAHAAAHLAAD